MAKRCSCVDLKLGEQQASAVEIYLTDPAHEGEFPGTLADGHLRIPTESLDVAHGLIIDAANSADDDCSRGDRDGCAARDALTRLSRKVAKKSR